MKTNQDLLLKAASNIRQLCDIVNTLAKFEKVNANDFLEPINAVLNGAQPSNEDLSKTRINDLNKDQQAILVQWCQRHDWGTMATITQTGNLGSLVDERVGNDGETRSYWTYIETLEDLWDFAGYEPEGIQETLDNYA